MKTPAHFVFLVSICTICSFVYASPDDIWSYQIESEKCKKNERLVESLWGGDSLGSHNSSRRIPQEKLEQAFAILEAIQMPSESDVQAVRTAVLKDPANSLPKYAKVAASRCMRQFGALASALSFSIQSRPELRKRLIASVNRYFSSSRFPVVLGPGLDTLLLEKSVESGIWPKAQSLASEIKNLRLQVKTEIANFKLKEEKVFESLPKDFEEGSQEAVAKVANSPDLAKLKTALKREMEIADKYNAMCSELVKKLN